MLQPLIEQPPKHRYLAWRLLPTILQPLSGGASLVLPLAATLATAVLQLRSNHAPLGWQCRR